MILAVDPVRLAAVVAGLGYAAAVMAGDGRRWAAWALAVGWAAHAAMLAADMGLDVSAGRVVRFGFAPVLSLTAWLVVGVHAIESRFVPVPRTRRTLAAVALCTVVLVLAFPGESPAASPSPWAPLHWILGVASYGLFGIAVLHALFLDNADRRMRLGAGSPAVRGMPLLKLERLMFRFVEAGFVVLTAAMVMGVVIGAQAHWQWTQKTVFTVLSWATFAALIVGRRFEGWRGRRATRWLYGGTLLLLIAYAGSRFVFEVWLARPTLG